MNNVDAAIFFFSSISTSRLPGTTELQLPAFLDCKGLAMSS